MRTTVYIDEDIYEKLAKESIRNFGNVRNISNVINMLLKDVFRARMKQTREDFSGILGKKRFDLSDLRDEHDRSI